MTRHPYLSPDAPRVLAHRGLVTPDAAEHGVVENSFAAVASAHAAGAAYVESDCHLTADGEVVLFHDDDLRRVADDPRAIADVRLHELEDLMSERGGLITLAQALEAFPEVRFNLDVKAAAAADGVGRLVAPHADRVLVTSFPTSAVWPLSPRPRPPGRRGVRPPPPVRPRWPGSSPPSRCGGAAAYARSSTGSTPCRSRATGPGPRGHAGARPRRSRGRCRGARVDGQRRRRHGAPARRGRRRARHRPRRCRSRPGERTGNTVCLSILCERPRDRRRSNKAHRCERYTW